MVISIAAAVLFIANIFRKGWVFPIIAVGLWGFISIVVGTIYPAVIQRFVVQPNEFAAEQTVHRAQHRRRRAPRSGSTKITTEARSTTTPTLDDGRRRGRTRTTLDNVRLWDPAPRRTTCSRSTQEFQPFYEFADVDVDRYKVGGDEQAGADRACASSTPSSSRATRGRTSTSCTRTATASVAAAANRT